MSIRVECEACGKVLNARDEAAGKKAKCPDCGNVLQIPDQDVVDAETDDQDAYGSASSYDDGNELDNKRPCPACGEEIKKKAAKCRFCGEMFDANLKRRSNSKRGGNFPTADLGKRFLGALADGVAGLVFVGPGIAMGVAAFGNEKQNLGQRNDVPPPLWWAGMAVAIVGALVLGGLQIYLLLSRSQSIGKYLVKTQIFDLETNEPAGAVKCFLMRHMLGGVIGGIPCIGLIYILADSLFVFRADHRCLHDLIAGTYVVNIS